MNLKQTVLASSMVAVFALPSFNAQASIYVGKAAGLSNDSAKIAIEQPLESSGQLLNANNRFNVAFPVIPGYSTSAVNRLFYRIALKGGVKFNSTPQMLCGTVGNGLVLANGQSPTTAVGGTTINFLITSNVIMRGDAKSAMCVLSFKATALSYKVADKTEQTISAVLQYKDGTDTKSASYAGSLISFTQSQAVLITAANKGSDVTVAAATINVGEGSKKFVVSGDGSSTIQKASELTAFIGTISFNRNNVQSVTAGKSRTGSLLSLGRVITTATITVAGAPVVGSKGFYLVNDKVSDNKPCAGTVVGAGVITPVGDTVTFTNVVPALDTTLSGGLEDSDGLQLCMVLTGDTAIDGGILTVTVGGTPTTGGWSPIFGNSVEIYEIKKNGSSFRVLNIPNPENGDKAYIRLYNPTTASVKVRGTFIGQDGAQIGTTQLLETVPANAVKIIDSTKLQSLFGVTTWTGRARLIVEAESASFAVQATIRTPNGILTNMGSETASDQ